MNKTGKKLLEESTSVILNCEDDFLLMKQSVDNFYKLFYSITGISAYEFNNEDISLPSGKAISPAGAAHCLMEMKRTAVFLRGIHKAIVDKQKTTKKPIKILYAGCGPYATLIVPLLTLFTPSVIQIALLDINPVSLNAVQKIISALELNESIIAYYISDASLFNTNEKYDIIISETMQACLKNEPQLAIMKNLIPQLKKDGIFIPERIEIDAMLTCPADEMENLLYKEDKAQPPERRCLGNIFTIDNDNLDMNEKVVPLKIPDAFGRCSQLQLFTTVTVYEGFNLKENDSSITMSQDYIDLKKENTTEIEFWYEVSENPKIHFRQLQQV